MSFKEMGTAEPREETNPYETAMFAAEIGGAPTVDLHEFTTQEAVLALDRFINHEFLEGSESVKIIHGRGTGKLRAMIQDFLGKHELVAAFRDSHAPNQIGGVTIAALYSKDRN